AKPSSPADFRPISVLCLFSKVFERLLHEQFYAHLEQNNLLNSNQFGFRSNVSTVDALLAVQYEILNARNNRQLAAIVQLDISDAFGSVPHKRFFHCLRYWDANGNFMSPLNTISIGVPQGSVLDPL
ncbi:uncharacterized protein B4U80_10173, partial [Leptotrombidium deliense]